MDVEAFDAIINQKYLNNGWDILTYAPLPTVSPDGTSVLVVLVKYDTGYAEVESSKAEELVPA
jgi:hypothetical protein